MDISPVTTPIQLKRDDIFSTDKVSIEHATLALYKEIQLWLSEQPKPVPKSAFSLELLLSTAYPHDVHSRRLHDKLEKLTILYGDLNDLLHSRDHSLTIEHRSLMATLQHLVDVLDDFKRETSLIQQKSIGLFGAADYIKKHLRKPLPPKMDSSKYILDVFDRGSTTLKPLLAAMKLVVGLENACLRKSERLQQAAEARERKITFLEATKKPTYLRPQKQNSTKRRPKTKLSDLLNKQLSIISSSINKPYSPFRDSEESNLNRHEYLRNTWLHGTCDWFLRTSEFWDEWLFGDGGSPRLLFCWGASGVGKSIIASQVVETLECMDNACAYFYLGQGHVQSAGGLVISLLSQFCDLEHLDASQRLSRSYISSGNSPSHSDFARTTSRPLSGSDAAFRPDSIDVSRETDPAQKKPFNDSNEMENAYPQAEESAGKPLSTLLEALRDVCSKIRPPVCIILDAWDKANMEDFDEFRSVLTMLHSCKCKVFLSSRDRPPEDYPLKHIQLEVGAPRNLSDIQRYVDEIWATSRVQLHHGFRKDRTIQFKLEDLSRDIAHYSNGVFSVAQMYTNVVLNSQEVAVNLSEGVVHLGREGIKWMGQRTRPHHTRELIHSALCGFNATSSGVSLLGLILIWLAIAPAPLSVPALEASLPSIFLRLQFPSSSITTVTSTNVSETLSKLSGFVTVDHGNQLVYLSSETVKEEVLNICTTSSALSSIQRSINREVAVYCLEYLMNLGSQVPNLETRASVDTLLRQHHFLAHAAMAWRTYCRDSFKSAMSSLPTLDVPRVMEPSLTPDSKILGEHISYNRITTGTSPAEIPSLSAPVDPEDEPRLLSMIDDFFDHSPATLSILVHIYLSKELCTTSSIDTWQGLHSWVSSMPKLHKMSKLGFVKLAYDKELFLPPDVNEADKRGRTPLHEAVLGGFNDDVQILLAKGAHPNRRDNSQETPLSYSMRGNDEIFILLFEEFCEKHYTMDPANEQRNTFANHYARCIKTNKESSTQLLDLALIYAIKNARIGVVTLLLDEGANPNCLDDEHIPALHHAILLMSESSTSSKGKDIAALLLMQGADPSIKSNDERGEPSLHVAARLGAVELVQRLVGYGADPCSQDSQGQSVLFAVVEAPIDESNKDYLLRWLLLRGAKVEQEDQNGRRVLHLAASGGMQRVILRLLKGVGALRDPKDQTGKTPFDYALEAGHEKAAALMGGDDHNCQA